MQNSNHVTFAIYLITFFTQFDSTLISLSFDVEISERSMTSDRGLERVMALKAWLTRWKVLMWLNQI